MVSFKFVVLVFAITTIVTKICRHLVEPTMRTLVIAFILLISLQAKAQNENEPQAVISAVFQAISDRNEEKLRTLSSNDLLIIEDAKLWSIDTLIKSLRKPVPQDYKRENNFQFISQVVKNDIACVTYENKASITGNNNHYLIVWMETAILVRVEEKWILKILHSTTKEKRKI
jgi:hypothetical protein